MGWAPLSEQFNNSVKFFAQESLMEFKYFIRKWSNKHKMCFILLFEMKWIGCHSLDGHRPSHTLGSSDWLEKQT